METRDWLQVGLLLVAVLSLVLLQGGAFVAARNTGRRTETKLRIFHALVLTAELGQEEIVSQPRQGNPVRRTSGAEIRKASTKCWEKRL